MDKLAKQEENNKRAVKMLSPEDWVVQHADEIAKIKGKDFSRQDVLNAVYDVIWLTNLSTEKINVSYVLDKLAANERKKQQQQENKMGYENDT